MDQAVKTVEQIAIERAEEQMGSRVSLGSKPCKCGRPAAGEWRGAWLCRRHYQRAAHVRLPDKQDRDEILNGRPTPAIKARVRCLAGDCDMTPMQTGEYSGYCDVHALRLRRFGTIDCPSDYLIWPITEGHMS